MIAKAKGSDSANEAAKIPDAAIEQCPNAPNANEAAALNQKYKKKHRQELAEKQQAQLRESKERGSAGSGGVTIIYDNTSKRRICADCSGRGIVEVYRNGRYYKLRCSSCNGTDNAGIYGQYIDSSGGRKRSEMEQNMGRMLGVP